MDPKELSIIEYCRTRSPYEHLEKKTIGLLECDSIDENKKAKQKHGRYVACGRVCDERTEAAESTKDW
jgi:hypothetical protein